MFLRFNFFTILWAVMVGLVIATPSSHGVGGVYDDYYDKIIHAVLFSVLMLLMSISFSKQYTFRTLRFNPVWSALIVSNVYGIILESVQLFTGRQFDLWDMLANATGTLIGLVMFMIIYRW